MENYEIPVCLKGIVKEIDHDVDALIKDPKSTRLLIEMPWSPVSLGEEVTVIIDFGDGLFNVLHKGQAGFAARNLMQPYTLAVRRFPEKDAARLSLLMRLLTFLLRI